MALQQHFRDTRRAAEIAVYLKRRVEVPEIIKRAIAEKSAEQLVGAFSIARPRPQI